MTVNPADVAVSLLLLVGLARVLRQEAVQRSKARRQYQTIKARAFKNL
jgi:hypothetical protein